jgi:hypothetical protein
MASRIFEALTLPALYRQVCEAAGLPVRSSPGTDERFVVRSGAEGPDLFAKLLEEAFIEDEAEVRVWRQGDLPDYPGLGAGGLAVCTGFPGPWPTDTDFPPAGTGGLLVFAIERRDGGGRLLGVTWAAVPENEPSPTEGFRATVLVQSPPGDNAEAAGHPAREANDSANPH